MGRSYRVLYLEDDPKDYALLKDLLNEEGVLESIVWANNRQEFETALQDSAFDILLIDETAFPEAYLTAIGQPGY